jgi:hypothetical protein
MNAYAIVLFVHIVAALAAFALMALEWTLVARLRRADQAAPVREWLAVARWFPRAGPGVLLLLLGTGFYLGFSAWREDWGWIAVSFISMFAFPVLGSRSGRRMAEIARRAAESQGPLGLALQALTHDRALWSSVNVRAGVMLGIVFVMTLKPSWELSALAVAAAAGLGWLASWPAGREVAVQAAEPSPADAASE